MDCPGPPTASPPTGERSSFEPSFTHTKLADGLVSYAYDATTGLRTGQTFHTVSNGNWSSVRTEEYTYDSQLDFLTGVDYNDGLAAEVKTWSYDAAGNRVSGTYWEYDNLNRMTKSYPLEGNSVPILSWTYEHDILGNRIRRNATTNNHAYPMRYDWDVLNRTTTIAKPSGGASYSYRADGQRIEKVEGVTFAWVGSKTSGHYDTNYATNRPSSRYYYDGQMGFEDDYNPSGTVTQVNRYILGARGIDRVARTESGNTTLAYPMYDGHGNMRALLTRNGTSYSTGNWKTYDVWGSVRSGGSSGDPKQGYVASIGHVSDSESSLIYMRARYYEPATGRFLSQDPAMDGSNWYIYCGNNPIEYVDRQGEYRLGAAVAAFLVGLGTYLMTMRMQDPLAQALISLFVGAAASGLELFATTIPKIVEQSVSRIWQTIKLLRSAQVRASERTMASRAVTETSKRTGEIQGALLDIELIEIGEGLMRAWW